MAVEDRRSRLRLMVFRIVMLAAFAVLTLKLWNLQVVSSEKYQVSADENRFRLVPSNAPRGIIYDRFGRMLVRNSPSFTVSIVPGGLPEDEQERAVVLARVSELIGMPVGHENADTETGDDSAEADTGPQQTSILQILDERAIGAYSPVRIATDVDRQAAFIIEEEHLELPGILVEAEPLRHYIDGPLLAHLLGYVGNIPSEDLAAYRDQGYLPDDQVGLTGIERTQEALLRGIKGQKHIEVDAYERQVAVIASTPPVQGDGIILTVDQELQAVVEKALRAGMKRSGAQVAVAVAMDPRTGEILALVSLPSYDNNLFSGGISYADYATLSSDRHHPLVNHAISGQYAPGSTFKLVSAAAGLQSGVIDTSSRFTCQGILYLPNKFFPNDITMAQPFYCWYHAGHGSLNITGAIMQSCDIFFYQLAGGYGDFQGLGIERVAEYASYLGYGAETGIELSGEAVGLLPSDRWKRQNYGESWYTGDTYNAAIGQGYVLATPLQVLNATAAVANGGTLYRPQLVYQVVSPDGQVLHALTPEAIRQLPVDPANLAVIREGMREAVDIGTAYYARLPGVSVAGKTGTAEYPGVDEEGNLILDAQGNLPTHAWFTCFAPFEAPEIALVVFLEGGGEGSTMAVPVAAEILRYYFALPESTSAPAATPTPQH